MKYYYTKSSDKGKKVNITCQVNGCRSEDFEQIDISKIQKEIDAANICWMRFPIKCLLDNNHERNARIGIPSKGYVELFEIDQNGEECRVIKIER